ncbi:MAG: hypothetical protein KQH63_05880 [Desulfobulbaceae bacterium]|nr:hypothetical protein [Desulfobulbaceae bacterium]
MKKKYDKREGYCRMLGHFLPFHYCRTMKEGLPCGKILDCWFEMIPIQQFIAENYSKEEQHSIFEPPKSRIDTIVEIVGKVEKDKDGKQD